MTFLAVMFRLIGKLWSLQNRNIENQEKYVSDKNYFS